MSNIFFNWDIKPDMEQEYLEFYLQQYVPTLARLGIEIDGWLNMGGDGPQVMAMGEGDNYQAIVNALQSREFRNIEQRLLTYVENYTKHVAQRENRP